MKIFFILSAISAISNDNIIIGVLDLENYSYKQANGDVTHKLFPMNRNLIFRL